MIICPYCKTIIHDKHNCQSFSYQSVNESNIISFFEKRDVNTDDYKKEGLEDLFSYEEKHFWFLARKKIILEFVKRFVTKDEKIIEVGAGTGNVASFIKKKGFEIAVGEFYKQGLEYAKKYGITRLYHFDLLKSPFVEEFDVVGMFDVLEHLDNEEKALENVFNMLKKNGKILITVPAHMWLWNDSDVEAHHKKRYERKEIVKLLEKNGFEVLEARYFFTFFIPLFWLRTKLNKSNGNKHSGLKINKFVNYMFLTISKVESFVAKYVNFNSGGSIIIIGRKK